MYFNNLDGKVIAYAVAKAVQDNKEYLSNIDGLIGDGDHGINMNKGFTLFVEKIKDSNVNLTNSFKILGRTLLSDIGGSMGPLYGTLFIEMSNATNEIEEIDEAVFSEMLEMALKGVKSIGNAQVGDKTLIDSLEPAVEAYKSSIDSGQDFRQAMNAMKAAAVTGRDSTKDMIAKVGRASRLGERSRGVLDAGAASCCLIICSLADAVGRMLKED